MPCLAATPARAALRRARRSSSLHPLHRLHPLARAVAAAGLLAAPLWLQASTTLPTGLQVVQGQASVAVQGAQMTVKNSGNAILNWQSFSIGAGAGVHFQQPGAASKVLNRVLGNDPSAIFGSLTSNGAVWLLNPNGVLFGAGARVDVAGLVASTLRLNDNDFLAGRYRFSAADRDAGSVLNEGKLSSSFGGQIVLLGSRVENRGSIEAPGGSVSLAASRSVELVDTGLPHLSVKVEVPQGEVLNLGRMAAAGGSVDIYAGIVNQNGFVMADALGSDAAGRVVLKASETLTLGAGSVTQASGAAQGGAVHLDSGAAGLTVVAGTAGATSAQGHGGDMLVQGQRILLGSASVLDVSGGSGGGLLRVGGDYQGRNAAVRHADMLTAQRGAVLRADAGVFGDGGRIIVWSDSATRFGGNISARGGSSGGNGGFVEVSAKGYLDFRGSADLRARAGREGTLLLDPLNITIQLANPDINGDATPGDDLQSLLLAFAAPGVNSIITAAAVESQLAGGNVTLQAVNNLSVNAAVNQGSGGNLTLQAGNNIDINAAISLGSVLTLSANDAGGPASGSGRVALNSPILASDVFITNGGGSGVHQFASDITANTLDVNGSINLAATNTWTLSGFSVIANNILGSGGLVKGGSGTLELTAPNAYTGGTTIDNGTLTAFDGNSIGPGPLVLNGGTLGNTVTSQFNNQVILSGGGDIDVAFGTTVTLPGVISGPGVLGKLGSGELRLTGSNSYSGATFINAGVLSLGNGGGSGSLGTGGVINNAELRFNRADSFTVGNFISGSGGIVQLGNGTTTISGSNNSFSGGATISGGTLRVTGVSSALGSGAITLSSGGNLDLAGGVLLNNNVFGNGGSLGSSSGVNTLGGDVSLLTNTVMGSAGGVLTIAGVIAGSAALTINGGVALQAPNSYSGGTTINAAGTLTIDGISAGVLGTIDVGAGQLVVAGNTNVPNALTVNGGTLFANVGATNNTISGPISITGTVTLGVGNSGEVFALTGPISGSGSLLKPFSGAGTLLLSGANTYTGSTSFQDGLVQIAGGAAIPDTSALAMLSSATLQLLGSETVGSLSGQGAVNLATHVLTVGGNNNSTTFAGVISGGTGAGVDKLGSGVFTLTGNSTYIGGTVVAGGTLRVSGASATAGVSNIDLDPGATLDIAGGALVSNPVQLASGSTVSSSSGGGTLNAAPLTLLDGATAALSAGAGSTLSVLAPINAVPGGSPEAVTVIGTGTVVLSGLNTYTGNTTVTSGTLVTGGANVLPDVSAVAVATGGALTLSGNDTVASLNLAGTLGGTGTLAAAAYTLNGGTAGANLGAGTLVSSGSSTLAGTSAAGTVSVNSGTLTLASNDRLADSAAVTVSPGATLAMTGTDTVGSLNLAGTLGGTGTLVAATVALSGGTVNANLGSGTLSSSGASTLAGTSSASTVNVNSGTLTLAASNRLVALPAVSVSAGAGLVLGGNQTIGTLDGLGAVNLSSFALSSGGAGSSTFAGVLSGSGDLQKQGAGTFTLSGANTYTGATGVVAGTLVVSGALASQTLQVDTGALLTLAGNERLSDAATLVVNGGEFNLGGFSETVGAVSLQGSGNIANGTLSAASNFDLRSGIVSAVLAGSVGIVKSTAGVVTLTGQNTYTGATQIDDGVLNLNNPSPRTLTALQLNQGTLGGTGDLVVAGGFGMTGNSVSVAGTGSFTTLGPTTLNLGAVSGGQMTLQRGWTNTGTLTLAGDDSLVINGLAGGSLNNTAAGVINLGTSAATAIGGGAGTTVFTNAGTVNHTLAGTHAITATSFSNSGLVDVSAGTLQVTSAFLQNGEVRTASGATFATPSGWTNPAGGTLSGSGSFDVGAGNTLTNQGTLRPATAGTAGTLSVTGNLVMGGVGTVQVDLGGTGAGTSDRVAVSGNASLDGTLNATLLGGYTPINGDAIPVVTAAGSSTGNFALTTLPPNFTAGYRLAAGEATRLIFSSSGGAFVFTNAAGNLDWSTPANWGGALPGASDTALISSGFAVNHATGNDTIAGLTVSAANSLNVSGGSLTVTGATTLGGSLGTSGSGALTLGGGVTGGAAIVTGGTLTFNGATTLTSLALSGGLLNGSGSLSVNGSFTRSGGATVGSGFSDVTLIQAAGDLLPGAWTAGRLDFGTASAGARIQVDAPLVATASSVTLNANAQLLVTATGSVAAAGNVVIGGGSTGIGGSVVGSNVFIAGSGGVQLSGGGGVTATQAAGNAIAVDSGSGAFVNTVGPTVFGVGAGANWLVYSADPALNTLGGLVPAFKQYNAPFGTTPAAGGNGLLYTLAPTLTATLQGAVDKVYDRNTTATLAPANYLVSGALTGETATLNNVTVGTYTTAGSGLTPQGVGTGKTVLATGLVATVTASGVPVFGYGFSGTASGVVGSITPVALVASGLSVLNKVYDGNTTATLAGGASITPLAGDVVALSGTALGGFSDKNVGSAKPVSLSGLSLVGADAANYTLTPPAGLLADITARPATVTGLSALNKVYDATPLATLNGTATANTVAGDAVVLGGSALASFADKNVGSAKPVTVSGYTLTGIDATNYSFTGPTGLVADITARPLPVTGLTAAPKVYDATTVATLTGSAAIAPLAGDTVLLGGTATGSFADKNVGTAKPVTVGGLSLSGADAANYSFSAPAGLVADITAAPLTLTGLAAAGKVYDATTAATASAGLGGVRAGDVVTVGVTAAFADANAGVGKTVNYNATAGGLDAANYLLTGATGTTTATITPATLTFTATPLTAPAGTALAPLTGAVTGFLAGQTLGTATTGTLTWTTAATVASPAGSYDITGGGLVAQNYTFVQAAGNATALTLTPAATAVAATNATNTAINLGLQTVQVTLAMSTPTESRVLDVTPAFASPNASTAGTSSSAPSGGDGSGGTAAAAAAGGAAGSGATAAAAAPVFRAVNYSLLPRAEVQSLLAARDKYKKQVFAGSLFKLEQDPTLADVRPCQTEVDLGAGNCLITEALKSEIQAKAARAAGPRKPERRKPKQAALPNIERKIALLIGVNSYTDKRVPALEGAVPDARAVRKLFEERMGYEATVLENPTRESILRAFNKLALEADANDSVVIYYAGHGVVIPVAGVDTGFWLPSDTNAEEPATWLSNADISRLVGAVSARQLMLVSDSCYSGSLVGGEKVQLSQSSNAADLLSRKAAVVMSSGGNEPVADEGREGHSIFAWHFMRAIEGLDQWQVGGSVFERVRAAVVKEFPQTPQYGAKRSAGHQGNTDFLFERREFDALAPATPPAPR